MHLNFSNGKTLSLSCIEFPANYRIEKKKHETLWQKPFTDGYKTYSW